MIANISSKSSTTGLPRLTLNSAPKVIYLFGVAGSGKSHIGQLIAKHSDYQAYEADNDLTAEMQVAIQNKQHFTDAMRDRYYQLILSNIKSLLSKHSRLVVMQGTYKQRHRDLLQQALGDDLALVEVSADQKIILDRLKTRGTLVDPEYANYIAINYQPPTQHTPKIINNSDESDIIRQLNQVFP